MPTPRNLLSSRLSSLYPVHSAVRGTRASVYFRSDSGDDDDNDGRFQVKSKRLALLPGLPAAMRNFELGRLSMGPLP